MLLGTSQTSASAVSCDLSYPVHSVLAHVFVFDPQHRRLTIKRIDRALERLDIRHNLDFGADAHRDTMRDAWAAIDHAADGAVPMESFELFFARVLKKAGITDGAERKQIARRECMLIDEDNDGVVTFEEFHNYLEQGSFKTFLRQSSFSTALRRVSAAQMSSLRRQGKRWERTDEDSPQENVGGLTAGNHQDRADNDSKGRDAPAGSAQSLSPTPRRPPSVLCSDERPPTTMASSRMARAAEARPWRPIPFDQARMALQQQPTQQPSAVI